MTQKRWAVYIVKCVDGKLYTGISNDVDRRIVAHNKGKGCRFTRGRWPVKLVYKEICGTKSSARKRELAIQKFKRTEKISLIKNK